MRHDGTDTLVEAANHTQAKIKGALLFTYAGHLKFPIVVSCRLEKGMN